MSYTRKLYVDAYILVLALYVYFNKGIAYTYLAEALLVVGLLFVLLNLRKLEIPLEKKMIGLLLFLGIGMVYIVRGLMQYQWLDVVRDSFIFNYGLFVLIIIFFKEDIPYLLKGLYTIYKWYPLVETLLFLCLSYVPFLAELRLFGSINLLHYKYGDMAVHLFISALLILNGKIKLETRFYIANAILIAYLFLIVASYSRAGMVSFVISFLLFFLFSKDSVLKKRLVYYVRFVPLVLLAALPFYLNTSVKENFQGRKIGLDQLKDNVSSITGTDAGTTLDDNKIWRLVWWTKIIEYTFGGEYFIAGKGLGMSLADDDDIAMSEENDLRSPHNFHLNILARFGVPIFLGWCYWLSLHFRLFRRPKLSAVSLMLLSILTMFLLNASFDVFLEGPMGAFPFWTFMGLFYINEWNDSTNLTTAGEL